MAEELEYAGFWIRFAAFLIDSVVVLVGLQLLAWLLPAQEEVDIAALLQGAPLPTGLVLQGLLQNLVVAVLFIWLWVKFLGTPGKRVLGLRVVDAGTGRALSTGQAIGRYLGYYVSMLPLFLGFIWIGLDRRKQGFHDKLAGSVVVREAARKPVSFD